jgi:MFS family permease
MNYLEEKAIRSNIPKLNWFRFFKWGDLLVVIEPLFFIAAGLTFSDYLKIMAIWMFLTFLFEIPSGAFADFIGRKYTLIISQVAQIFQYGIYLFANTFLAFLIAKILGAVAYSFQSGTDSSLLYDSVKAINLEKDFKKINGIRHFMFYVGIAVFFPLGAFLFSIYFRLAAIAGLFFMCVCLLLILLMKEVNIPRKIGSVKKYLKHILFALKLSFKNTNIRFLILYSLIIFSVLDYVHSSWSLYLKQISIPVAAIGVLSAFVAVLSAFSSKAAHKIEKRIGGKKALFPVGIIFGILVFLHGLLIPYWGLLFFIATGLITGYLMVIVESNIHEQIKTKHRATILSINNQIQAFGSAILFYGLGYISTKYSFSTTYTITGIGVTFLVMFLAICYLIKKLIMKNENKQYL